MNTGVSAWTYLIYNTALKSLKGDTYQAELTKGVGGDNQILEVSHVANDREIDFRISHYNNNSWTDSTWQYVNGNYPRTIQINGGMVTSYIATYPGKKKLSMRTVGHYIGVTGIYGSWWASESEYNEFLKTKA